MIQTLPDFIPQTLRRLMGLYLAGSMGLFAVLLVPSTLIAAAEQTTPQFIMAWASAYAISLLPLFLIRRNFTRLELLVAIVPLFYTASALWSNQPVASLQYGISLLLNAVAILALARLVPRQDLPLYLGRIIIIMCLAGVLGMLAGLEMVKYFDIHARTTLLGTEPLRGFFNHKITAALYAVIGFFAAFIFMKGALRLVACAFLVLFILLTGSMAGFSLLLIGLLLFFILKGMARVRLSVGLFLTVLIAIPALGVGAYFLFGQELLLALGRDPTLTGRTLLWEWGLRTALERPLLGWGYRGYNGSGIADTDASTITAFVNYAVPHFHNSYIQTMVEAGLPSAVFIIGLLLWVTGQWYKTYRDSGTPEAQFFCIIMCLGLIAAGFINILFQYNTFSSIIFMMAIAYLPGAKKA